MKDIMDTLQTFFLGKDVFQDFGIEKMKKQYSWPIKKEIRSEVPGLPDGDGYKANVALKLAMSERWRKENSLEERKSLTRLIIRDWGGINANSDVKISAYATEASKEVPNIAFSGIASFSKVLAILNPEVYAIYDARVAVALNSIHIIGNPTRGELYPYLPGRNTVTGWTGKKRGFSTLPQHARQELSRLNPEWVRIPRKSAYQSYLTLLNSVIEALSKAAPKIYDLEMCLFSQAEKLAILAAPELKK